MQAFKEYRAELEGLANPTQVYSDHKALEYFMTTKNLSTRQARWAKLLSRYHFKIIYRAGKANQKADALIRREEDVKAQNALKKEAREQIAIPSHKVDSRIKAEIELAPMSPDLTPITLTDHILRANRTDISLQPLRDRAIQEGEATWSLENGLLLCQGRLAIPDVEVDGCPLQTSIIKEAHAQVSTTHPGIAKTTKILRARYY
jgi:hypothetical protein